MCQANFPLYSRRTKLNGNFLVVILVRQFVEINGDHLREPALCQVLINTTQLAGYTAIMKERKTEKSINFLLSRPDVIKPQSLALFHGRLTQPMTLFLSPEQYFNHYISHTQFAKTK